MTGIIIEMRRIVTAVCHDEQQATAIVYALIRNLGGERLYIPHNNYTERNNEMKCLYQSGATVEQLASRYRLCEITVQRIVKKK
jgi:Mor family transcriptional regulator